MIELNHQKLEKFVKINEGPLQRRWHRSVNIAFLVHTNMYHSSENPTQNI